MNEPLSNLLGFEVIAGEAAELRECISNRMSAVFKKYGYQKIDIPLLEHKMLFSPDFVGTNPWPGWHPKSIFSTEVIDYRNSYDNDSCGEAKAVLVPEGTASVCRHIASSIYSDQANGISKLYYITKCFRNELVCQLANTKQREFTQIGIEFIGEKSIYGDIEIFDMVILSLTELGILKADVKIRYSDVRLFNYLVEITGLSSQPENLLKNTLDAIASVRARGGTDAQLISEYNKLIQDHVTDPRTASLWQQLVVKTDSIEELKRTLKGFPVEILDYLYDLNNMGGKGISDNLYIDLSIIRGQEYYNKIVFQVDIEAYGGIITEIGGGGRYDFFIPRLMSAQEEVPATGIAFSLERLSYALTSYLSAAKIKEMLYKKGIVLWCDDPGVARDRVKIYQEHYHVVEVSYHNDVAAARDYARRKDYELKTIIENDASKIE